MALMHADPRWSVAVGSGGGGGGNEDGEGVVSSPMLNYQRLFPACLAVPSFPICQSVLTLSLASDIQLPTQAWVKVCLLTAPPPPPPPVAWLSPVAPGRTSVPSSVCCDPRALFSPQSSQIVRCIPAPVACEVVRSVKEVWGVALPGSSEFSLKTHLTTD